MSHKNQRTLQAIFAHPINMNIHWKDVVRLFESLGADVEIVNGGREKVQLNGTEETFHIPHGKMIDSKAEIVQIRHFLERAGAVPKGHS